MVLVDIAWKDVQLIMPCALRVSASPAKIILPFSRGPEVWAPCLLSLPAEGFGKGFRVDLRNCPGLLHCFSAQLISAGVLKDLRTIYSPSPDFEPMRPSEERTKFEGGLPMRTLGNLFMIPDCLE